MKQQKQRRKNSAAPHGIRQMSIKAYKDLNVFRESYQLTLDVSRASRMFPGHEQFELGRQIRRAARSIPVNIVEGWAKRVLAFEVKRFLQISVGSCEECKFWLEMGRDEHYLGPAKVDELVNRFNVVGAMFGSRWKNWQSFAK
jgi:four helix bundle protein